MTPAFPPIDTLRLGQPADSAGFAAPATPAPAAPTAPAADTLTEPIPGVAVNTVEAVEATAEAAAPLRSVVDAPAPDTEAREAAAEAVETVEAAPADTLVFPAGDTTVLAEPFDPVLTAGQTFGELSELTAVRTPVLSRSEQLTDQPLFQGVVLVLLIAYMLLLCAHLHDILGLFLRKRSDYLRDGGHALNNGRAIQTAVIIGLLTLAAVGVRLGEESAGGAFHTIELLSLTLAAVLGIALVQCGALALIGRITLTTELTRAVIHFKALYFSIATLIAMPAALLLIFCPPGEGRFWFWALCLLTGTVVVLFLKETFMLFLRKKISILHWFLYLCTVECFPVSLVWLLATRR